MNYVCLLKACVGAIAVASVDQVIKAIVRRSAVHAVMLNIPGIVQITHCTNKGVAFSAFSGAMSWIIGLSILLLICIALFVLQKNNMPLRVGGAVVLLLGGGIGNLIDRIVFNGVTDYIRLLFIPFPVFNFADICITVSVMVISYYILTGRLDMNPDNEAHGTDH